MLAGAESDGAIINWLGAKDVPKAVPPHARARSSAGKDPTQLDIVCRIFVCMSTDDQLIDFLGRRAIAGYLTVPVYAKFHEWLGRGELLRPMWEAWGAGRPEGRNGRDPARDRR